MLMFKKFDIIADMQNENNQNNNPFSNHNNQQKFDSISVKKPPEENKKLPKKGIKNFFKNLSKKQKIFAGVIVILLIGGSVAGVMALSKDPPPPPPVTQKKETAPPKTTEASRLTGIEYPLDQKVNERTVTGVMIENSPDARPQSGLTDAGVVYEAVAEGGITRFLALFQDIIPNYVGPVRSVRPYYLDFLGPYDAGIAHVGGSGQALNEIRTQGIKDLDQFHNTAPYWRENSRYAPHNMYTDINKLKIIEVQKGWKPSAYQSLLRGAKSGPEQNQNAKNINIRMSSPLYAVTFNYDATTNSYKRSVGSRPHVDAKSGKQISPTVVVVPIIPRSQNGIYSVYPVNSSGKVLVFQNGTVIEGTWSKASRKDQFILKDTSGQPLKLVAGQTWFTIASSASDVNYTP